MGRGVGWLVGWLVGGEQSQCSYGTVRRVCNYVEEKRVGAEERRGEESRAV